MFLHKQIKKFASELLRAMYQNIFFFPNLEVNEKTGESIANAHSGVT